MAEKFISKNFRNGRPLDPVEMETVKTEIEEKLNNIQPDDIDGLRSSDIIWEPGSIPADAIPDELLKDCDFIGNNGDLIQEVPNISTMSSDPLATNAGFVTFNRLFAHDPISAGWRADVGYISPIVYKEKFAFLACSGSSDAVNIFTIHGGPQNAEIEALTAAPLSLPAGARPVHAISTLNGLIYIAADGDTEADCRLYVAGKDESVTEHLNLNAASLPTGVRAFGIRKMYPDRSGKFLYAITKSTSGGNWDTILRISIDNPGTVGETDAVVFASAVSAATEIQDVVVAHPDIQNPDQSVVFALQTTNGTTGALHAFLGNNGSVVEDWTTPPTPTTMTNPTTQSGEALHAIVLNDDGSLMALGNYTSGVAWALVTYDVTNGWGTRFVGNSTISTSAILPGSATRDQRAFYAIRADAKVIRLESGDDTILVMTPTTPWPSSAVEKSNVMFCGRTCVAHVSVPGGDGTSVAFKL